MPKGTERGGAAIAVGGNTIFLAEGLQPQPGDTDYGKNVVHLVSMYDTTLGRWTQLPNFPGNRDHVGGAYVGDTLYVTAVSLVRFPTFRGTFGH